MRLLFLLSIALFNFLPFLSSQTIYVDADAAGANNGTSWANAYTSLQSAIPLATASNEIWVAAGTYKPHASTRSTAFVLLTGTKLYGGFNGTETLLTQRNPKLNITTLSGDLLGNDNANMIHTEATRQDNSYNLILIQAAAANVTVDGFTISGANGNGGAGVRNSGAVVLNGGFAITITTFFNDVIFEKNTAVDCAVFRGFTPAFNGSNTIIEFNVTNSIIRNNACANLPICSFVGTSQNQSGQTSNDRVRGGFKNTLFHDNVSTGHAACIYNKDNNGNGSNAVLNVFNCTFTNNSGISNRVVQMQDASSSRYRNCIVYGNGTLTPIYQLNSGTIATTWANCIVNDPVFGINQDPLFRDAANDDYRFDCTGNSPAIGAGTMSGVTLPTIDLAGNPRQVGTIDIGCYEYLNRLSVSPTSSTVCGGSSVTFSSQYGTGTVWSDGIVEGVPYFPTSTITVTATGTNANNCLEVVPVTLTVPVITNQTVSPANTAICPGGSATITLANSQTDIYYSLVNDATNAVVMGPTQGTGAPLSFNLSNVAATTTYHVDAMKPTSVNGALDLDGVNDYVTMGTSNRGITSTLTVTARIRTTVTGTSQFIVNKYLSAGIGFYLLVNATGQATMQGRDIAGAIKSSGLSTTMVADNQWHEITGVVRSTGWEIWVDGVLENSGAYSLGATGLGTTAALLAGQFNGTYSPADIDYIAIWKAALTPAQIQSNLNTCLVGNETNLVGYFKLDHTSGTVATDLSISATNGTLTNMTVPAAWIVGPFNACTQSCDLELSQLATVTVSAVPSQPTITASGSTTICSGGSVTLTAPAASSYLWSNGATTSSISVSSVGSYTVQVSNAAGCQSVPSAATVVTSGTAPAQPSITAGGATSFCTGGSVTLTATTGSAYLWSNGATTSSITVSTAGTYTVQVSNAAGCQSAASAGTTVTVNALPAQPSITAGGATSFCTGGSVTLTATAGSTYLWSSGATTSSITVSTAGTYTVQVSNAAGCQSAASAGTTVTVNALPAQPSITAGGATSFCTGGSVTLTATAGSAYLWSNGATTSSITVSTAGTYTVQVSNAAGCQSAASAGTTVTVNTLPAQPSITAGGSTSFCTGGSVTLTATTGSTYLWSNGATTASINVSTAGTYTVQVSNAAGCQSAASAGTTVTVNALPAQPSITASGATSFCTGGSVTLTATTGSAYLWSNGATTASITISTAGTYTVQVSNAAGCQSAASDATTVTVNALPAQPSISASGATSFCTGGSVTLTASTGSAYLWSNGATTSSISVSTAGAYTVQVSNAAGCQSAASAGTTVTVNALPAQPSISASGATSFCTGGSVTLTATTGSTYLWSNGATTASISVSTAGAYTVQVSNAAGCQSAASAGTTVTVNTLPAQPSISASGATSFCTGGSVTLTASTGSDYLWSNGATTSSITVSTAGTYTVQVSNAAGCQSAASAGTIITMIALPVISTGTLTNPSSCTLSDGAIEVLGTDSGDLQWTGSSTGSLTAVTLPISVNNLANGSYSFTFTAASGCASAPISGTLSLPAAPPAPTVTASGSTTLCAGEMVTLTSSVGDNYLWSNGATTQSIDVLLAGSYTVIITDAAACSSPSSIATTVVVNALPDASTSQNGNTITATNQAATAYQWIDCNTNQAIVGETNPSFTPTVNGNYAVTVFEGNCSSTSACTAIVNVGLQAQSAMFNMQLVPNPATSVVTILSDVELESIEIYTIAGQLVQVERSKNFNVEILPSGVYVVKAMTSTGAYKSLRLVKQ
jgi:hypothetical protein